MPTGFTAKVSSGEVTEFREYALSCARAFGALVTMRDDSPEKPIPEKFEASQYHNEQLLISQNELTKLESADCEQYTRLANDDYATEVLRFKERKIEIDLRRSRYYAMLAKARAYIPPTDDHKHFAEFMISQLEESIKFDCHEPSEPEKKIVWGWFKNQIKEAQRMIEYHTEGQHEEDNRTAEKNKWLADLRESLKIYDTGE